MAPQQRVRHGAERHRRRMVPLVVEVRRRGRRVVEGGRQQEASVVRGEAAAALRAQVRVDRRSAGQRRQVDGRDERDGIRELGREAGGERRAGRRRRPVRHLRGAERARPQPQRGCAGGRRPRAQADHGGEDEEGGDEELRGGEDGTARHREEPLGEQRVQLAGEEGRAPVQLRTHKHCSNVTRRGQVGVQFPT